MPDGTEVVVHIEPLAEGQESEVSVGGELPAKPFFGMWADRSDMEDSAAWVRSERKRWQRRDSSED